MRAIFLFVEANSRNPLIEQAGILPGADMAHVIHPTGKTKSFKKPFRRSNQASRLLRASPMISNWTGRPVFCWITVADPSFEAKMALAEQIMREDRDILRVLAK